MQAQGIWSAGEGDDNERFLADLRALRDTAAIGQDELAARTHYPDAILKEAENGPSLPGLPVLAAYVRACDGDVLAWEERWRQLGLDLRADPGLPARAPGASPAAVAGARASAGVAQPEAYDPDRIRAVLRGIHHSDRGARGAAARGSATAAGRAGSGWATAEPQTQRFQPGWNAGPSRDDGWGGAGSPDRASTPEVVPPVQPGWDTGFQPGAGPHREDDTVNLNGTRASGSYQYRPPSDPLITEAPAEPETNTVRHEPLAAGWRPDSEPEAPDATEYGWPDHPGTGLSPAAPDSWFTPRELGSPESGAPESGPREPDHAAADPDATQSWFTPREQADAGLAPAPPAAHETVRPQDSGVAAADVTIFRPPAEEPTVARTSWSAPANTPPATRPARARAIETGPAEAPPTEAPPTETGLTETGPAGPAASVTSVTVTPARGIPVAEDPAEPAARPEIAAEPSHPAAAHAAVPGPASPSRERRDRLYLVRLLVVIVVAAIIGSVLVLLLR